MTNSRNLPQKVERPAEQTSTIYATVLDGTKNPTVKDIYGNNSLKEELNSIVNSIYYSGIYAMMGSKNPPRRFMFTGHHGTGKTMAARAIGNELGKKKPGDVIFMPYDVGRYGTKYINEGSTKMQEYFDVGQSIAIGNPEKIIIYFFDEADSVMSKRGGSHSHKEDDKVLNTLMTNINDLCDRSENEYFFGATNFQENLDEAAIRKGRIDQIVKFNLPDEEARLDLFKNYVKQYNQRALYRSFYINSYEELVNLTKGFSYSDIASIFDAAIHKRIKDFDKDKSKDLTLITAPKVTQKYILSVINDYKSEKVKEKAKIGFH